METIMKTTVGQIRQLVKEATGGVPSYRDAYGIVYDMVDAAPGATTPALHDLCAELKAAGTDTDELIAAIADAQEVWEAYETGGIEALEDLGAYAAPEQANDKVFEELEQLYTSLGLPVN